MIRSDGTRREDRLCGLLGGFGAPLLVLFLLRTAGSARLAVDFGHWQVARLDLLFVLALLIPSAGVLRPLRRQMRLSAQGGDRASATWPFVLALLIIVGQVPALTLAGRTGNLWSVKPLVDTVFLVALASPSWSMLRSRAGSGAGPMSASGYRAAIAALLFIVPAIVFGKMPGVFLTSLAGVVALILLIAATAAVVARLRCGPRAGFLAAWSVVSCFIVAAAAEVGLPAVVVRLLFTDRP
jgi:hypothetical protein